MPLLVPIPTLSFESLPGSPNLTVLEKPLKVLGGAVTFADGKPFDQSQQATAGFFIYRQQAGLTEIWNEAMKLWFPASTTDIASLKSKPLAYQAGEANPWQGLLVPATEKDTAFKDYATGYQYSVRAYFVSNASTGSLNGLSPPSAQVQFTGLLDSLRAGIKPRDGTKIDDTDEIQLFLRNDNRQTIGSVLIREEAGAARVEISNFNGAGTPQAVIRLLPTGDIEIQAPTGREIRLRGALAPLFYQPADATGNPVGSKRWLP